MAKFIVNKLGAVHSIPDDWETPEGARPATDKEIAAWYTAQGLKREATNGASEHDESHQSDKRPNRRSGRG